VYGIHEERRSFHVGEVRELVVAGIRVVKEAALLYEQLSRVHAREGADVPAAHPLSRRSLHRVDREPHPGALLVSVELPVVRPPVAVADDLVLACPQPGAELRVALEGDRAGAEAHGDPVLVEEARQPPYPDPAAELEVRLGAEIAPGGLDRGRVLTPCVVRTVAVEEVVLGALLIIHNEANRDRRPVGPAEVRRLRAVSQKVPRRALAARRPAHGRDLTALGALDPVISGRLR